jgi:hypothetical protein
MVVASKVARRDFGDASVGLIFPKGAIRRHAGDHPRAATAAAAGP